VIDPRPLIAFAVLYIMYVFAALGDHDPILTFVLFPINAIFLGFLEGVEWVRFNADR
jgi:hypothetical protein